MRPPSAIRARSLPRFKSRRLRLHRRSRELSKLLALDEVLDVETFALANVNVRAGPTAQTEKLVTISNGDPVAVTGKTGDWFQIALADGRTGYILGRYLGLGAPAPEPPPGPTPTEIELAFWDAVKAAGLDRSGMGR